MIECNSLKPPLQDDDDFIRSSYKSNLPSKYIFSYDSMELYKRQSFGVHKKSKKK